MSSEVSLGSEKPQTSEFDYHVRMYRDDDRQQVHHLYEYAMLWHPHSPLRPFLKLIAKSPIAKALYLISALGALLWPSYPTLGPAICLTAGGGALFQLGFCFYKIMTMTRRGLHDDLADIRNHYQLVPSDGGNGRGAGGLQPSGPRAFWVVEATHKVTGKRELAGCGGLDIVKKGEIDEPELRRMVVSVSHIRRGVAAMVVRAAIAQAKSHELAWIYLSTSSMQEPAINLYKKYGWVEEKRRGVGLLGIRIQAVPMRLHLKGKGSL